MTPDTREKLSKLEHHHKYDHGHALILSGSIGRGGAARLAARGALRIGAGVVTVGCPPSALLEHATQLNAIMCRPVRDADHLTEILVDRRVNTLCIGPGLGTGEDAGCLVKAGLKSGRALVLDADALTLIGTDHSQLPTDCILTPHEGEFARLFPDLHKGLYEASVNARAEIAQEAANRAGCTLLLKGHDTVVASPGENADLPNAGRSAPWLATAGSGDVLAGFLAGLLARGFAPHLAAQLGAWLHMEAAIAVGPGLIAEDLPEALPQVFRALDL